MWLDIAIILLIPIIINKFTNKEEIQSSSSKTVSKELKEILKLNHLYEGVDGPW